MSLDRPDAEGESFGDLSVVPAICDQSQDVELAGREAIGRFRMIWRYQARRDVKMPEYRGDGLLIVETLTGRPFDGRPAAQQPAGARQTTLEQWSLNRRRSTPVCRSKVSRRACNA